MSTIGIFDSGVGGLTVLQAMRPRLPMLDFIYLGDTARLPYGSKSASTVRRYAVNATRHLIDRGVQLVVVACNTASASALDEVVAASPVPVVGVVEPGVESALASGARHIAVIGTEGTIGSEAYQRSLQRRAPHVKVDAVACPLFVPLAEEGWGDHPITDQVAWTYLSEVLSRGVEALILGCTHYPLLKPSLARIAGPGVKLVDSATAVTDAVIDRHGRMALDGSTEGTVTIHLTDASQRFLRIAKTILGEPPEHLEVVDL